MTDDIRQLLATGKINYHPDARDAQIQWARETLRKPETPYRAWRACQVIEALSQTPGESATTLRIRSDLERKFGKTGPHPRANFYAVFVLGACGFLVLLTVAAVVLAQ